MLLQFSFKNHRSIKDEVIFSTLASSGTEHINTLIDFDKDANTIKLAPKARLYTVKNPSNDLFKLELIYHRGFDNDNRINDVAEYIGSIGTEKHSKNEFAKAMQKLGSSYSIDANRNNFIIYIQNY